MTAPQRSTLPVTFTRLASHQFSQQTSLGNNSGFRLETDSIRLEPMLLDRDVHDLYRIYKDAPELFAHMTHGPCADLESFYNLQKSFVESSQMFNWVVYLKRDNGSNRSAKQTVEQEEDDQSAFAMDLDEPAMTPPMGGGMTASSTDSELSSESGNSSSSGGSSSDEEDLHDLLAKSCRSSRTMDLVGVICFMAIELEHRRCELGPIWFHPRVQGSFIMVESSYILLRFAFERLQNGVVEWKCCQKNIASQKAAVRLGFGYQSTQPKHVLDHDGTWRTSLFYSMTDDDWFGRSAEESAAAVSKTNDDLQVMVDGSMMMSLDPQECKGMKKRLVEVVQDRKVNGKQLQFLDMNFA